MLHLLPTADGSLTLYDDVRRVHYHSTAGAVGESQHVYLQASQLATRLAQGGVVRVLEVGFGTGLNFVLSAVLAADYPQASLHYTAYEPLPPPSDLLQQFYAAGSWDAALTALAVHQQSGVWHNSQLHLQGLPFPQPLAERFEVCYYDAFGPADAPELWTEAALLAAYTALAPGGVLVTFSVSGATRRILHKHGIAHSRPRGYARKREMLVVHKS